MKSSHLQGCPTQFEGWIPGGIGAPFFFFDVRRLSPIHDWDGAFGPLIAQYGGSIVGKAGYPKPITKGRVFCALGVGIFELP